MLRGRFGGNSYFSDYKDGPNAELLIQNFIRDDIPKNILNEIRIEKVMDVLNAIYFRDHNDYVGELFEFNSEAGLIKEVKIRGGETPRYVYHDGVETITYYDYKKSGKYREMGILNYVYYLSFVYNSLLVRETLFNKIYKEKYT